MTDPTPFHSHVDRYLDAGWPGVLPLPRNRKHAPPTGYTGAEGAYPTVVELDAWRRDRTLGNIALRMPPTVVGIDVDAYNGKPGWETWQSLAGSLGPPPDTWTSTSRSDGRSGIRFYRLPEPIKLIGALPGIEIIQRHHRYAVVAPSQHPEGGVYRWISPDGEIGDLIPQVNELPTLPDTWVQHLQAATHTPTARRAIATGSDTSPAVDRALGTAIRGLRHGTRHDSARDGAVALTRLAHLNHPGATQALDDLRNAFLTAIADRSNDREATAEWDRIETGANELVATTPSSAPPWEPSNQPNPNTLGLTEITNTPHNRALAAALNPTPAPWPTPEPAPTAPTLPPVPIDALPAWIADQVHNVTRQLLCDPMLPFCFALGALSVASLGHIHIRVRTGETMRSTGIYIAAAGPPASGKSPAMDMMFDPLRDVETRRIEQAARTIAEAEATENALRDKIKIERERVAKLDDHDDTRIKDLTAQLATLNKPSAGELMTSDITPERLATLMAANTERIAIVSDESGVLNVDRYGDKTAAKKLDIYLQAFTGQAVAVHRVKADTVRLRHPLLAIVAGVQPEALTAAMADHEWRTRGMGARFLTATTHTIAANTDIDRDVWDDTIGDTYRERLTGYAMSWSSWMTPAALEIAPEGRQAFSAWAAGLRRRELADGDLEGESGWSSKMRTTTLRVAALLHLTDGQHTSQPIAADTVQRAIRISEWFIAHHTAETDAGDTDLVRLAEWFARTSAQADTDRSGVARGGARQARFVARRDLGRSGPRGMRKIEDHADLVHRLIEHGLIRPADGTNMQASEAAKRSKTFEIHPEIEAWVACATARDSARQTPGENNESSQDSGAVAHVAHVAKEGISDPSLSVVFPDGLPPTTPPPATSATSATPTEPQSISEQTTESTNQPDPDNWLWS